MSISSVKPITQAPLKAAKKIMLGSGILFTVLGGGIAANKYLNSQKNEDTFTYTEKTDVQSEKQQSEKGATIPLAAAALSFIASGAASKRIKKTEEAEGLEAANIALQKLQDLKNFDKLIADRLRYQKEVISMSRLSSEASADVEKAKRTYEIEKKLGPRDGHSQGCDGDGHGLYISSETEGAFNRRLEHLQDDINDKQRSLNCRNHICNTSLYLFRTTAKDILEILRRNPEFTENYRTAMCAPENQFLVDEYRNGNGPLAIFEKEQNKAV